MSTIYESYIFRLGYPVNENSVKILKESDEGIYMWYAVNLLTGKCGNRLISLFYKLVCSVFLSRPQGQDETGDEEITTRRWRYLIQKILV